MDEIGAGGTKVPTEASPDSVDKLDVPQVLPTMPLRNAVLFPGSVLRLTIGRAR